MALELKTKSPAEIAAMLVTPIDRLVIAYTDSLSLGEMLAQDNPPVIDCRRKVVPGNELFWRELLADICDHFFYTQNRAAMLAQWEKDRTSVTQNSAKTVNRCGGGKPNRALHEMLDSTGDELSEYRYAYLIAVRLLEGMSAEHALAEVREIVTGVSEDEAFAEVLERIAMLPRD